MCRRKKRHTATVRLAVHLHCPASKYGGKRHGNKIVTGIESGLQIDIRLKHVQIMYFTCCHSVTLAVECFHDFVAIIHHEDHVVMMNDVCNKHVRNHNSRNCFSALRVGFEVYLVSGGFQNMIKPIASES